MDKSNSTPLVLVGFLTGIAVTTVFAIGVSDHLGDSQEKRIIEFRSMAASCTEQNQRLKAEIQEQDRVIQGMLMNK